MHKKSIEAQSTLRVDGVNTDQEVDEKTEDRHNAFQGQTDIRFESIATLRAKAMEHCAKLTEAEKMNKESDKHENHITVISDSKNDNHKFSSLYDSPRNESDDVSVV